MPYASLDAFAGPRLVDPRDLPLVHRAVAFTLTVPTAALLLYALPTGITLLLALPYLAALYLLWGGRLTLLLHVVCHRPLFRAPHRGLNRWIPWLLAPFLGHTPTGFFVHHIGMHHAENNGVSDLSATSRYVRDELKDWLVYLARFLFLGNVELWRYLGRSGRIKLRRWLVAGELGWLAMVCALWTVDWAATLVVFVLPLCLTRVVLMVGNFAQHAFVDVDDPEDAYRNSTCLLDTPYNDKCYNDGYHIVHHLRPSMHWSEMPAFYEENRESFAENDAVVFQGLRDNQQVWMLLMRHDYDTLARHVVNFRGRSHEECVAWLQSRVRRTSADVQREVRQAARSESSA